jgi:hypothetical protein
VTGAGPGLEEIVRGRLSGEETKLLLRLGDLHAMGRPSKHRGGYRDYEVVSKTLSDQDIWLSKDELVLHGLATEKIIDKFLSDGRRQKVSLTDLTTLGFTIYLNIKFESGQVNIASS